MKTTCDICGKEAKHQGLASGVAVAICQEHDQLWQWAVVRQYARYTWHRPANTKEATVQALALCRAIHQERMAYREQFACRGL